MSNIREVAKAAGVSIATVSRVLNNSKSVSSKTRERILTIIDQMQFTPNGLARSLALNRSNTIALLIPNIINPLYPQIAKGIEDIAHQKGYHVLLCNTEENQDKENQYIDMLTEKRVDGLILTSSQLTSNDFVKLQKSKIPFVLIDKNLDEFDHNMVYTDHKLGSYMATQHLIENGFNRIAIILGPLHLRHSIDKCNGYKLALAEKGIEICEEFIVQGNNEVEDGYLAAKKLLSLSTPPRAIFSSNDLMAIGAIDAIKSEGFNVPDDIAVVGYDDIQMATLVEPKLTTISQPVYKMGLIAARLLFDSIESNEEDFLQKIYIQPKLMVRKSCGHEGRVREIFN